MIDKKYDNIVFDKLTEDLLKKLDKTLEEENANPNTRLKTYATQFLKMYRFYYEQPKKGAEKVLKTFIRRQKRLKESIEGAIEEEAGKKSKKSRMNEKIDHLQTSLNRAAINKVSKARALEALLTGFKSNFLKILNKQFVQIVVIEGENYAPVMMKANDFTSLSKLIESQTIDFQGKLMSEKKMWETIALETHGAKFKKLPPLDDYVKIYQETRSRLNAYYETLNRQSMTGQALLLYKYPDKDHYTKFYVLNLGDVKEGYVNMVYSSMKISNDMEENICHFAESYISQVDNAAGTIFQDIQSILNNGKKVEISVKSGTAQTGSHTELIDLIKEISKKSVDIKSSVGEAYNKTQISYSNGKGQRNKVLHSEENQQKIKQMLEAETDVEVDKALKDIWSKIENNNF